MRKNKVLSRRGFLFGVGASLAVVSAASLMPVRNRTLYLKPGIYYGETDYSGIIPLMPDHVEDYYSETNWEKVYFTERNGILIPVTENEFRTTDIKQFDIERGICPESISIPQIRLLF